MATPKKEEQARLLLVSWHSDTDERRIDSIVCEVPGYPDWRVLPTVASLDHGLELQRLLIEPVDDSQPAPGGIPTRMLRALRTRDLVASYNAAIRQAGQYVPPSMLPELTVNTRVGRGGRSDAFYLGWAVAYLDALEQEPASPIVWLAKQRNYSESSVRNLINKCRPKARGLLTDSPPGRPGGTLTPKALRLLEELDDARDH